MSYRGLDDFIRTWRSLSETVSIGRAKDQNGPTNEVLRSLRSEPGDPLATLAGWWLADNLVLDGALQDAIQAYAWVEESWGQSFCDERRWGSLALEQLAEAYAQLGDPQEALWTYERLVDRYPEGLERGAVGCRMAELCEELGDTHAASRIYQQVLALPNGKVSGPGDVSPNIQAESRLAALGSGAPWARDNLWDLVEELALALTQRDISALSSLAPPEWMFLGVGAGERVPLRTEMMMELLYGDLQASTIEVDTLPLRRDQSLKAYVRTEGWDGRLLQRLAWLQLARERDGWIWVGVVLASLPDRELEGIIHAWDENPLEEAPVTGLETTSLKIKAPWREGVHMRAGGLVTSIFDQFLFPHNIATKTLSPCGWGIMGFWYGQGTHNRRVGHYWALDFTNFTPGFPYAYTAGDYDVLAIADGVVDLVVRGYGTGHPSRANKVVIGHSRRSRNVTTEEAMRCMAAKILGAFPKMASLQALMSCLDKKVVGYSSEYWHLKGPWPKGTAVKVSLKQWAPQGKRLGYIDDTGNSAFDHLHFVVIDSGKSVPPSPMDGQDILVDGQCMYSTNGPVP
jgi:hypothetical protein